MRRFCPRSPTLAGKVQRDDFVYLHLSGHGAQQPQAKTGNETDGLDEIFLPKDIDKWVNRDKGVPNALMDDEIGAALDAIRDKGAFIWAIFDCCHSGTATRGAEADESERKVEASDLGIPEAEMAPAQAASRSIDDDGQRVPAFRLTPTGAEPITKGKLVAFYAAQTIETTPEMPLPKGNPDAERFGLFTFTIFSKLAENPDVTYRQLGQAVLQQYSADSRTRPTPLFEGELDARVFGTEKTDAIMQWPIVVKNDAATIGGGLLHRLTPGTKLAILPSALSQVSDAARLSRGAVGEESGEPGEAGRVRRQAGAEARRHSCQCLCPRCRARRRLQARGGAAVDCRGPRR